MGFKGLHRDIMEIMEIIHSEKLREAIESPAAFYKLVLGLQSSRFEALSH